MLNQFLKNTNQVSCHFGTITQLSRLVLQGTQTQFPVGAQVSKKNSFFLPTRAPHRDTIETPVGLQIRSASLSDGCSLCFSPGANSTPTQGLNIEYTWAKLM